ncbi:MULTISPECIES: DUF3883 domain-containing protein [Stenotrophomonas]|uniref:sacsin N-terminal ATP-binding-like domain-containing protein n=1 Tax=Stenotrophomonas TaxID=40323 RepID=UPI001CF3DF6F|nr:MULTISPECIES: DUF3883 domain-containing protein [Stenotrophomonas]MCA7024942.1 DUF3883 domain-containing protein [Stenotrophomonas acidaminiphila]MCE4074625.1 DUF3883 domain-containing protein [Stenotrophomonas acidaminiphila]
MASNYEEICRQNREDYGKKGARKSGDLAAGLYDAETHFIYELLQNAEDALKRRGESWEGSRQVSFTLSDARLEVSHHGHPFTESDVRSVCDISESTKDENSIGRFGLGFKSVYKVSDLPEIHSGDEDFVIEDYVFPRTADKVRRNGDETQIFLPLKTGGGALKSRISAGLKALGASSLLFLRHIREVSWSIEGGESGLYLRDDPEALGDNVSRIKVIGQGSGSVDVDQDWLVFQRDVGKGRVELAFSVVTEKGNKGKWSVQPLPSSPLVVFFPTAHATNLGFYLQGPFQSTPSRDNIRSDEPWNHHLVAEAASLLVEAITWLRDNKRLDINALRCLPLDRAKFSEGGMFTPLFEATLKAFKDQRFLPDNDGGYLLSEESKLGRTSGLHELFNSDQLSTLYGVKNTHWLTGEITQDRANDIRQFITKELEIKEVHPRDIFPMLTKSFLESQTDEWIESVYEFLKDQSAIKPLLANTPLVRLLDGTHVAAKTDGQLNAFLPTGEETGFPTVKPSACTSEAAIEFLTSLGLHTPDPVDAVIRKVLPKYQEDGEIDVSNYEEDIARILSAFKTDSASKRFLLTEELKKSCFVMAISTSNGDDYLERPGRIYIATDRLVKLFDGVEDVSIVDNSYDCLRGEDVRELLEACGALRYPRPVRTSREHWWSDRLKALRVLSGYPETSGQNDHVEDWMLYGFAKLIEHLPNLSVEQRIDRARLIWESLGDLEERRGRGVFEGTYTWTHRGKRNSPPYPASFVRDLNEASWVPDASGDLVPPQLVVFESLGWKANPFLQSKIIFKPNAFDQLAKEADVDPAALDLLRKFKLTESDLAALVAEKFGVARPFDEVDAAPKVQVPEAPAGIDAGGNPTPVGSVYDENKDLYGDDMPDIPEGSHDLQDSEASGFGRGASAQSGNRSSVNGRVGGAGGGGSWTSASGSSSFPAAAGYGKRTPGSVGGRPFISYVGAHPDEEEADPDGLTQTQRMHIEAEAIKHILEAEPYLYATEAGNAGFDLLEKDTGNQPVRWIEVKAMTGALEHRPVTLSHTQFRHALQKHEAYWLYVVEFATIPQQRRILRIRNPAGTAKSFTFDEGWKAIASSSPPE